MSDHAEGCAAVWIGGAECSCVAPIAGAQSHGGPAEVDPLDWMRRERDDLYRRSTEMQAHASQPLATHPMDASLQQVTSIALGNRASIYNCAIEIIKEIRSGFESMPKRNAEAVLSLMVENGLVDADKPKTNRYGRGFAPPDSTQPPPQGSDS